MSGYIIDENVPLVANGCAPQADAKCRLTVIDVLEDIIQNHTILIDDAGELFAKYLSHKQLSMKGQPQTGDAFLKHVYITQYDPQYVQRVSLKKNADGDYLDFPNDPRLKNFHYDDRIFIALAAGSHKKAFILNAVDSDYFHHEEALKKNGIKVEELCPHCLQN